MRVIAPALCVVGVCVGVLLVSPEARAQAPRCDAPQVLIVLDQSSSMGELDPLADGSLKWTAAVSALTGLTSDYESTVDFGLMLFPSAGECTPGTVNVPIARNNADEIEAALPGPPPYTGNYTPMADSLYAAGDYAPLNDGDRRNYVALITDGWEWCDPYDSATRFDPVDATEILSWLGITTFVIGFGGSVDSLTLNQAASVAGTALPGCDPWSTDPTRSDNCYYQVDDLDGLSDALDAIAVSVTEEVCDGLDNNCDGDIDEGLSRGCSSACGLGHETCVDGLWTGCDAPEPETEVCDGVDNDCDGDIDPDCECVDGETRTCGTNVGECTAGTQQCVDGMWRGCDGEVGPHPEVCDGLDNNCDGTIDPGCACVEGESRACGTDEGECTMGTQSCVDGVWSACDGATGATDEVCDGVDNDCDGILDEGCQCIDGETQPCGSGEGECSEGTQLCVDGRWASCDGAVRPADEVCDGLDNDCDGEVDEQDDCAEGEVCVDGECRPEDGPLTNPCDGVECGADQECIDGVCVDVEGPGPISEVDGGGVDSGDGVSVTGAKGCDCQVTGRSANGTALSLVLSLLAILGLRRR